MIGQPLYGSKWTVGIMLAVVVMIGVGAAAAQQQSDTFSDPLGDVESAQIFISALTANFNIAPLSDSDNLLEADVTYGGEVAFDTSGSAERLIILSERPRGIIRGAGNASFDWNILLNPTIPLALSLDAQFSTATLDLSQLMLTRFSYEARSGSAAVLLPATPDPLPVAVDAGLGTLALTLPDGGQADLSVNMAAGELALNAGDDAAITIGRVQSSAASVTLTAGANAAIVVSDADLTAGDLSVSAGDSSSATVFAETAAGDLRLSVGAESALFADVETANGDVFLAFGEGSSGEINAETGRGDVLATLPPAAAVRLEIIGGDRGTITVPPTLLPDASGRVWETEGYAEAETTIRITVDSFGGDVTIR